MKKFFIETKDRDRDSYIWNIIASGSMAFQSVIILMIMTRTVGIVESGIFTIAYASANLFLNIGKYGMRNFQVSDVSNQFSVNTYIKSRLYTTTVMMVVSFIYVVYTAYHLNYTLNKSIIIIIVCIMKAADAIEDVYCGYYQQHNRLDIAAKIMSVRIIVTTIILCACLIVYENQIFAIVVSTIATYVLLFYFLYVIDAFLLQKKQGREDVWGLLKMCFPLFLGAFMSFYIGNAPKYAIDANLSDELQACYGFISMPVFVIGLLNNFIFAPVIFRLSKMWLDGKKSEFIKRVFFQVIIVFGITLVCIVGAYLFGIPVLSLIYDTELYLYKKELIILLLGGGFLGLSGLLNAVITIIRFQKWTIIGYGLATILASFLSDSIVKSKGIMGAAILYDGIMLFVCICFLVILIIGIKIQKKTFNS